MLRVLVGHMPEGLFCECLAVPLHQAQSAAHGALLDSALFCVGLGISVFSKGFVAVAYPGAEERAAVPLKKSGQPHPDPGGFARFSPIGVSENELW